MNLLIQSSLGLFTKGTNHKSDKYLKLYFILKGQKTLLSRVSFLITNFIISHQKNNSASNEYDTQKLVDGKDFKNISGINESNSSSSNLKTVNIEGNALQSNIEAIRDDMCAINSEVVLRLKSFNDCLCQCKFGNLLTTSDEIIEAIHNILLTYQLDEEVEKLAKKQLNSIVQITKTLSSFIVQSNEDLNLSSNNLTFIPSFDGCRRRPTGRRRSSNSDIDEEVNHTNPSPLNPNINPNSYINNNSEEIVICRICDEQIPVELFEEHTESCISAYQSETILSEINDALLEIEQGLIDQYLNVEWPDVQKNAISMTMPIEHFNLILHRAILIDPHGADAPEELQSLIYEIDSISHMMENKVITVEGMKIKTALTEKKHASFAFRKEREILKKTRISGSDQTISQAAISDFDIIKRISSGAYARVFLVRKKKTGDIYALKVLPKADVSQKNQVKRILAEKDILLQFNNPYIINFYYSIIGYNNLYLVMEYLPGGDLYSLLKELGSLDEESAKNYTAQIAQALGYLHSNGIIHRDLKPDNILVSASGYLKLTDFGLSYIGIVDRQLGSSAEAATNFQSVSNGSINGSMNESSNENIIKSSSFVGTPDYVAPEIVLNQEHSFTVDWWSLGIMLYEFIMGVPPFHGQTEQETHEMILKGIYTKPDEDEDDVSPECIDIINKLLQLNPKNRLGCNGAHEVLSHPWFSDIDFNNIKPVFKPELKSQEDTGYFQERYEFKGHNDNDIVDDINRSNMHHKIQQQTPFSSNNFNSQRNRRKLSMGQLDFNNIMTSHSSGDAILVMNPKTRNNLLIEDSYQKTDDAEESESSEMAQFPSVSVSQLMEANMNELTARRRRTKSLFSEEDVPPKPTVSKSFLALGSNIGTHKRRMSRPVNFKMLNPERPVTKSFVAESGPENKEKSELK